jgi:hypothetical protein
MKNIRTKWRKSFENIGNDVPNPKIQEMFIREDRLNCIMRIFEGKDNQEKLYWTNVLCENLDFVGNYDIHGDEI